jgi:hypothetical protein
MDRPSSDKAAKRFLGRMVKKVRFAQKLGVKDSTTRAARDQTLENLEKPHIPVLDMKQSDEPVRAQRTGETEHLQSMDANTVPGDSKESSILEILPVETQSKMPNCKTPVADRSQEVPAVVDGGVEARCSSAGCSNESTCFKGTYIYPSDVVETSAGDIHDALISLNPSSLGKASLDFLTPNEELETKTVTSRELEENHQKDVLLSRDAEDIKGAIEIQNMKSADMPVGLQVALHSSQKNFPAYHFPEQTNQLCFVQASYAR